MITNYNNIKNTICKYVVLNPITKEIKDITINTSISKKTNTFNSIDSLLQKYNDKGFNIYSILNDFSVDRKEINIKGYNTIGIDIDTTHNTLEDILDISINNIGLYPSVINKTYKGYHVYFNFNSELYNLSTKDYNILYKQINIILEGDEKMKTSTGILKVVGYSDMKEGRSEYKITNIYNNDNKLKLSNIELLLNKKIKLENRKEKQITKLLNKDFKNNLIESIDSLELINTINSKTKFNINLNSLNIDNTSGLKLYKENTKYTIKDFSGQNRQGNRLFILNYVLKDLEGDDKMKEYRYITSLFGIVLNKNYLKEEAFPLLYILGFKKDEIVDEYNKGLLGNDKGFILRLLYTFNYLYKNKEEQFISEKEILEFMNLSYSKNNKDKIRLGLVKLSGLKIRLEKTDIDGVITGYYKNIIELEDKIEKNGKRNYKITFMKMISKYINISKNILEIKNDNKMYLGMLLASNLNISSKFKISIKELLDITGLTSYDKLRERYLLEYKKEKIIKGYEKKGDYILYY